MLETSHIRTHKDAVIQRLALKQFDAANIIEQVIALDDTRKQTQQELDTLLNEANTLAKQVGDLFKQGKKDEAEELKNKSAALKERTKKLQDALNSTEENLKSLLLQLPNLPDASVPAGKTPQDNEVVDEKGNIPKLGARAKPHWELAAQYNLIDFELGVKITGAGFPVYRGKGAKLQRALIQFFLDRATQAGYEEIMPPIMINEDSGYGTGQLPDKEGQMYHVQEDNLYLIPTA